MTSCSLDLITRYSSGLAFGISILLTIVFYLQTQGDGDSDSGDEALEHDVNPEEVPAVVKEAIRTESQLHLDADQTPADQK